MQKVLFEKLKNEFETESNEILKLYCDAIWDIYREINDKSKLVKIIKALDKKAVKAEIMFLNKKRICWFFYFDSIDESLKRIMKTTTWDNTVKEEDGFYIIDPDKNQYFDESEKGKFDIFILENPIIFKRVFEYFFEIIRT